MNQRIFNRCVEIAKALKHNKVTGKSFHGSFIVRKSRIICIATNNYNKAHNDKKFGRYDNWKGYETEYKPCVHSELAVIVKYGETDLSDCEFVNVRVDNNGNANMSKACPNCFRLIASLGGPPKKLFYSDGEGNMIQDERL